MSRMSRVLRFVLGLALFAGLGPPSVSAAPAPPPRAERPTYGVGEKWIRTDGEYELIRIEGDRYVFSAGAGREIELTKDLAIAKVRRGEERMSFDPPPKLTWPLEIGKSGRDQVTWYRSWKIDGPPPATYSWKVEAYEDVQTVAGRFTAFRIVHSLSWRSRKVGAKAGGKTNHERSFVAWYAPEVRQFVKVGVGEQTEEGEGIGFLAFQVLTVDRPNPAPLQVVLREPKEQSRITTEGITLTGKATGGKGVSRVTVSLNGQEVSRQEEKAGKPEVPIEVALTLEAGKNVLLVTATDPDGTSQQEARTLFYDKPTPASPPPVVTQPAPPPPAPSPVTPPPVVAIPSPPAPVPATPPVVTTPPPPPLPPFQVLLTTPLDQARVEHESIGLAGVISGGKGVSRVVVTLNGVEVTRQDERTPLPALPVSLPVRLREGSNALVVTATEADGKVYQEVRTVVYEKRIPLTVVIRYPEDKARVTDEASVIAAMVTSSKGVAKVTVTVNGTEVHQQTERAPQKSLVVTAPVTLREGPNVLVVSAGEPDGTVQQEVRTVFFDKPKAAAPVPPPPPPPPTRNRWAVVVGVGRYESSDIPRLRYTVPDAEAIYQVLVGPAGFEKEHVFLLTDKTERKPTLKNIKWALGTFLARSAQKDDTVLIFFAGHGAPEVDQRGIERDGLAKYLIPSDAEPDDLYSTALPMDELQTIFGRIEAERVMVFLDACYSGAAGGRTFASKSVRALNVDDLFLERLTRSKGRAIITASRPAEVSLEVAEFGHGLFTYYLLQGLNGAADLNRDGIVSLQELYEYVEQQVTQKSRSVGGNQHPVMKGELEGVIPLVKVKRP
ncbi:MAG: caspase family protein [candidate division NC10 bacterium]|nr:caspase family protein [candidate division NC10 bacterium]